MILYHVQTRLGHERVTDRKPSDHVLRHSTLYTVTRYNTETDACEHIDSETANPAPFIPRLLQDEVERRT